MSKPSELTEDQWIRVSINIHPDTPQDENDPIAEPTGSIFYGVEYSQLNCWAIDREVENWSDGVIILSDSIPGSVEMMDKMFEYYCTLPNAVITRG
jgi:hypothetical protein